MPLTNIEIASHIADDNNITWVPAEELLVDAMESCVDGRGKLGIVGTPGVNAGELLLALATLERGDAWHFTEYDHEDVHVQLGVKGTSMTFGHTAIYIKNPLMAGKVEAEREAIENRTRLFLQQEYPEIPYIGFKGFNAPGDPAPGWTSPARRRCGPRRCRCCRSRRSLTFVPRVRLRGSRGGRKKGSPASAPVRRHSGGDSRRD